MKTKIIISAIACIISFAGNAQHRNYIWCFGDSAGINFSNLSNPLPIQSAVKSRGSCVSIADTNSNILFSAYTRATINGNTTLVVSSNNFLMQNGNNIVGEGWYMELVIVPFPNDTSQYYLFSVGVTGSSQTGLYYSKIDMNLNNGLGAVTQKNVQLLPYAATDGLTCVKHGNGRDWWVIFRKNGYYAGWYDNRFYKYLVTPTGVNLVDSQAIGSLDLSGLTRYFFNKEGNKLASVNYNGQIETFDFDRCTGNLSNYKKVRNMTFGSPPDEMFSGEFSASGQYLYIATNGAYDSTFVIQIDLQNPLLYYAADTIGIISYPIAGGGFLKRGPDDKIYFACSWYDGINFNFPYPDTTFNVYNTHLSVINSPNSMGTACNFTPFSFYLGGNRTYYGLPNNPDYDLPRLQGSSCDTVQWTSSPPAPKGGEIAELRTTYVGAWQKLFVNAQNIKGKNATLKVYDLNGRIVFSSTQKTQHPYFTQDVDVSKLSSGMYIVSLETESEVLNKKFVKQ